MIYWQSISGHQLCYLIKARSRCCLIAFSLLMDFKDASCGQPPPYNPLDFVTFEVIDGQQRCKYFFVPVKANAFAMGRGRNVLPLLTFLCSTDAAQMRYWDHEVGRQCSSVDCRCCLLLILTKYSMYPCEKHTHQPGHSQGLCGWTKSENSSCKLSWSSQAVAVLTHWLCLHVLYTRGLYHEAGLAG